MPRVVVASDKFKGSLSAAEVAEAVGAGLRRAVPDLDVVPVPVADGGDGTLLAARAAGFELVPVSASGPTGEPVDTAYARRGETAVVELAAVSGLELLPGGRPAPLTATSRGTGEVLRRAVADGCRDLVLGIGGSACTDGGAGLVAALGARLYDARGDGLPDGGAALTEVASVDLAPLREVMAGVRVTVACDVDNPLTGDKGAAAVYGPQKGADDGQVSLLDGGLARWADVVAEATGADRRDEPGAGAAGGVGFAALALLDAELRPGIDLVLDLVRFRDVIDGSHLVVTGEGAIDAQTLHGKAPVGVAAAAQQAGVPVVAVAGSSTVDAEDLRGVGIEAVYALADLEPDRDRCLVEAAALLERLGGRIAADRFT